MGEGEKQRGPAGIVREGTVALAILILAALLAIQMRADWVRTVKIELPESVPTAAQNQVIIERLQGLERTVGVLVQRENARIAAERVQPSSPERPRLSPTEAK